MRELVHGGDIYSDRDLPPGTELLDFSANINPLGMPPAVREALVNCADACAVYPDPLCRKLTSAIAAAEGIPTEWTLCGAGAAELIFRLAFALRPDEAQIITPTFSEYAAALAAAGCRTGFITLNESAGFVPDEEIVRAIRSGVKLVFFCNPNNPTGLAASRALVCRMAARCRALGAVLAVDECFGDFMEEGEASSAVPLLASYDNLIVFKAFTKMYAMAGVRLGYVLCANRSILDAMDKAGPPWSVSSVAQACGLAALDGGVWAERTREFVRENRQWLTQALEDLGFWVCPSRVNFLFFRSQDRFLADKLERRGVLIRRCGNFSGLDDRYYRAAVRGPGENERLIACLRRCAD